ncbi:MAG: HAD-IC family P-type ATPase, partial [Candidatus Hydrogenedentes bacterium]|nr:HAD-IC family P-type ATPase [Candidatus Hydrogenedentota bacterium]
MGDEAKPHHSQSTEDILEQFAVQPDQGLNNDEVARRREKHGLNKLREAKGRSVSDLLLSQFKSVVILVLVAACVAAFAFGEWVEGMAIVAVIFVNTVIGFVSEWKAVRSMEALRSSEQISVRVRRGGQDASVPQEELVPGDILYLEGGDVIPADTRLIECNGIRVKEAALTGESVPVHKQSAPVAEDAPLAERHSMGYSSTVVTEGTGLGLIVATGMNTEIGQISEMAEEAESERTPLERQLNRLGRRLAYITLAVAAVVAVAGVIAGRETVLMIETAIALGVAAIPEGLPIVATIALARGMYLMARRNAVINVLTAVETLGATRIILTDKTGTLTENDMRVKTLAWPGGEMVLEERAGPDGDGGDSRLAPAVRRMLEVGVLCNNAALAKSSDDGRAEDVHGDPTEVALLLAGETLGIDKRDLSPDHPEVREVPFDSRTMMMATYHENDGGIEVAVKGAPAAVLSACTTIFAGDDDAHRPLESSQKAEWEGRMTGLAGEGLRLLAVADKRVDSLEAEPYRELRFLGLVGLFDPPRKDVRDAIA